MALDNKANIQEQLDYKQKEIVVNDNKETTLVVKPNRISDYNVDDDDFVFPPGYRFCPHDEELIVYYLKKKVMKEILPHEKIKEVNLYRHTPQQLSENYPMLGEREWYFFTPRDRKYPNGNRPNRAAGTGYWKATGADKPIKHNNIKVGFRKALVFYQGKPPKGEKTNWIMHEFRVNESRRLKTHAADMRLDDWVLCRIYKKVDKSYKGPRKEEHVHEHEQEQEQLEDASRSCSSVGKMENNCDYEGTSKMENNCDCEGTIDSCGELARQHFETPHQYDMSLDDPNFIMDYYTKYSPDYLSHYGTKSSISNYGMQLQPSFSPGNMMFLDHKGNQENNFLPVNFDFNNFFQDPFQSIGDIQPQYNVLNGHVLDENSSIHID